MFLSAVRTGMRATTTATSNVHTTRMHASDVSALGPLPRHGRWRMRTKQATAVELAMPVRGVAAAVIAHVASTDAWYAKKSGGVRGIMRVVFLDIDIVGLYARTMRPPAGCTCR